MADIQNTSSVDTIATTKPGLVTDLNPSYLSKEQYSYARNAVRNSKDGDLGTLGNEPSTIACIKAPYKILGQIDLPDATQIIFSGDGINSEIGLGNPKDCSYKTLKNLSCFGFSDQYPITGQAKKDFIKGNIITFGAKNTSLFRIELNKINLIKDCTDALLFRNVTLPCITAKKGQVGNMPNGSYSVALAYTVDKQIFTDFFSLTNRIQLNSLTGSNSIDLTIDNLDTDFKEYSLIVVGNYIDPVTKGATKVAKNIGIFSTKTKKISITDFLNAEYTDIPLSTLVVKKQTWQRAGIISSNSNYLILGDLVGRAEENYQLKAMQITSEYVVDQVEADYYEKDGSDVGYYRDENYDFWIQGVYKTGEVTDKFHIPGRRAKDKDRELVASADVYEYDTQFNDCADPGRIQRWQVENTASKMIPYNQKFSCNRRTLGYGELGYHESTDLYPDNTAMFGTDANTPIRYARMPDETKVSRYSVINDKSYINILGVRFHNIQPFDSPDIVGYKITRSDRKGGNGTVIARGLLTNVRSYQDPQLNQTILYSNYTVNDLNPDSYLSSTQTSFSNGSEHNYTPLTDYYKDRFNFYSPHTMFEPKYSLGTELKIETEEIATVTGKFELVYKHPKQKLLNQFSFWLAAAVGFIESVLVIAGKNTHQQEKINEISLLGLSSGTAQIFTARQTYNINSVADLVGLDIVGFIASKIAALDTTSAITTIKNILVVLASLAIKIPYSIMSGIIEADKTINTIYNFTGYTDYTYQYNAVAKFDRSIPTLDGDKRRRLLKDAIYLPADVVSIDDKVYNNTGRERSVYMELNKPISDPVNKDDSRRTMSEFGSCDSTSTLSTGSAFYATSKAINPNQYGALGTAAAVSMHSCIYNTADTPTLFGGDCVITRFQFLKKMKFFSQDLAANTFQDGTEYDYRKYRNIAYPRFWIDSTHYDFSSLIGSNVVNYSKFSRTTTSKYNLDCKKNDTKNIARIDDAHMYLSNNCAMDFFVEADYNTDYREKTEHPYYSKLNTNLQQIFRSDRLTFDEEFTINRVYSDLYATEIYASPQREDFDPSNPIPVTQSNAVIYSLPSFNLQQVDNWQYFLPANYFSFPESDFGKLTGIHKLDQDRIIFLFSASSPYLSMGRDFLQLEGSGRKITIGDGGLFAQDPREIMPTNNNFGACNSPYAFANTHLGRYYPSANQGRILEFNNYLDDIARYGNSYWCKNYMPVFLYEYFPNYPQVENPIGGVGYLISFDSFSETIYLCKRDFSPRKEYAGDITFDGKDFKYKGTKISLRDSSFFNDISWTLSFSPMDKGFVSFHDWHPDWIIQTDNHFMSIKGDTIYKHGEAFDSFCNFYGVDYPFEYEAISTSGQQVETIRSIEYILEVYKYKNFGRDRFHVLNENFNGLIIRNTEQISPLLIPHHANPDPEENLRYPSKNSSTNVSFNIAFHKEENKYRINQFWDATRDRGEFSKAENHLFPTDESGYKSVINPLAVDMNKPEEQRKKFRHMFNKFRFIRTVSGNLKFIVKILNIKKQISPR